MRFIQRIKETPDAVKTVYVVIGGGVMLVALWALSLTPLVWWGQLLLSAAVTATILTLIVRRRTHTVQPPQEPITATMEIEESDTTSDDKSSEDDEQTETDISASKDPESLTAELPLTDEPHLKKLMGELLAYREPRHAKFFFKRAVDYLAGMVMLLITLVALIAAKYVNSVVLWQQTLHYWIQSLIFLGIWVTLLIVTTRYRTKHHNEFLEAKAQKQAEKKGEGKNGKPLPLDRRIDRNKLRHPSSTWMSMASFVYGSSVIAWLYIKDQPSFQKFGNTLWKSLEHQPYAQKLSIADAWLTQCIPLIWCLLTLLTAYSIFRQAWWWRHFILDTQGDTYLHYPSSVLLNFSGGDPVIYWNQLENCNDEGTTLWERLFFKNSRTISLNGAGQKDKPHFDEMSDIRDPDRLIHVVEHNRRVYLKWNRTGSLFD